MIYAGLIHFNDAQKHIDKLSSVLALYTQTSPTVMKKNAFTLWYGKLSNEQDMDEIWENDSSVLIGRIFDKVQGGDFRTKDFKNLSSLNKEEVLKKMWGKYVYIHSSETGSQFDVVVDSTGQLPFFYYIFSNGNILFASDIEIIFKVLAQKSEINWTYLCSYLIYGNSSAIQTPFQNIYELPPACCLKITKNERTTTSFWNPLRSYQPSLPQEKDAVEVLQATLKPWVNPYKNICVSLSGGLDSSSLVYCLKDILKEDQTLSAVNYFHSQVKSSNELVHARKVCQETGIDLVEIDASHSLPFDPSSPKKLLNPNKPFPGLVSLKFLENTTAYLASGSSCIFLSGHGSDHIFMQSPSKRSVADYILEKGLKGSKEPLNSITQFYRDPLFSILKETAISLGSHFLSRQLEKRHPKNTQDETPKWINQKARHTISPNFVHPIYGTLSKKILPGKYDQIDALYEGLASVHMEMSPIHLTHYPFLYEPVVEFALSFPTYNLFEKGYDRYPLRKAVSDRFKTDTVWRRDKSQTTGLFQLGIKKNLEYVLDLCLEGQLIKQGFIDREGLYKTIKMVSFGDNGYVWPLIHIASIEMFLKFWEEKNL
ncbi:MAG: hypothetical protein B7Y25_07910 [Alphaproteobacteria bacterium 16-39-46]|nr:MAG: hypothetical protein B7Y25_07910 [Alphaproteobacteria bacterium 16-39-46]OZA41389.1 MAG: hypothetical protein B7X84_08100 [Alphaproteobacteria bacterium 17-39-52]HQS84414.1 asparagine synthase-related protein [Alphaproteobacteria bacterium]HQS94232.1 asparagine synthase-related protein [Alphaproteobacteria bacterium]